MKNRVVRIFLDVDFRNQHTGLSLVASKHKVDVDALKDGEHLIFVNSKRNKIKMYSSRGVLSYLRLKKGVIDLNTLVEIPKCFSHNLSVSYDKALTKVIKNKLNLR